MGHIGRFDFSSGLCLDKALCINFFTCKTVLGFGTNVRAKEKSGFYKLLKDTCGLWHYVHAWAEPPSREGTVMPLGSPGGISVGAWRDRCPRNWAPDFQDADQATLRQQSATAS